MTDQVCEDAVARDDVARGDAVGAERKRVREGVERGDEPMWRPDADREAARDRCAERCPALKPGRGHEPGDEG